MIKIITLLLMLLTSSPLQAITPEERAQSLGNEIRCAVCAGQSVNDSAASMAADFRRLIRERIAVGDSDQQVRDYLAARYGDAILLRPPVQSNTALLWTLPLLILLAAALFVTRIIQARGQRSS